MKLFVPLAAAIVLLAGCAEGKNIPDPERLHTFVGKISGTRSYISVITAGNRLAGYISDGGHNSVWLATAQLEDGHAVLAVRGGAELGEVTLSGDSATGQVTYGPELHGSFEARKATGRSGLFTTSDRRGADIVEVGWILLENGSQRGSMYSDIDGEVEIKPAPWLRLEDPTVQIPHFGSQPPLELDTRYLDRNDHTDARP